MYVKDPVSYCVYVIKGRKDKMKRNFFVESHGELTEYDDSRKKDDTYQGSSDKGLKHLCSIFKGSLEYRFLPRRKEFLITQRI